MNAFIFSPGFIISNVLALLILILACRRPLAATIIMTLLFMCAAVFNICTAIFDPDKYLLFADTAVLPAYERFINGYFSDHIRSTVLIISLLQLTAAFFMPATRPWSAISYGGAAFFLLAIAPLGAGSAFPCSLMLAAACIVLIVKGYQEDQLLKRERHLFRDIRIADKQRYEETTFPHY